MSDRVIAYQHGIYPRSEEVVAATRGLERGRTLPTDVDGRFVADLTDLIEAQQQAGLDYFSDGMLRWQDIFRPFVEASAGMRARALVRWFDNNSFFRSPVIADRSSLRANLPAVFDATSVPAPRLACLPSPYLFSRAADVPGSRNAFMLEIARQVLRPAVEELVERGYRLIHLQDPWLTFFGIEPGDWMALEQSLGELRDAAPREFVTIVLHTYFGDAAPLADRLRRLPVDVIGLDVVESNFDSLKGPWDGGLLLGCLDGRRSLVEPVNGSVRLVRRIADSLEPAALYLSSNCDLEFLPSAVAQRKIMRLGEVARRLRGTP
jgi:5-methyltetrahydropteroyltriglutamate--homocysteine methyltransferase